MEGMKKDPRVRKDGKCYVCKKPRRLPKALQKGVPVQMYELDPFCSSVCARVYHANPLPSLTGYVTTV
jgi:hypothetical protein